MRTRIDRISFVGLGLGLAAIMAGQLLEGGRLSSLFQPAALVIVLGGTMGATMLQTRFPIFMRGMRMGRWAFVTPMQPPDDMIRKLVGWAQLSRREGILVLEKHVETEPDPFIRKGVQLLVDGADSERLREVMEVEITTYENTLRQAARVWDAAAGYSPTVGILGAVLGLIHVMENLGDPTRLGAGIATAFVATIYGVGAANLLFLPIGRKLQAQVSLLISVRELFVDGLVGIANGDNPRIIESRLLGYVAPIPD
ncbi:MAG: flagellar motor protein [Gammaproteobacteria bacterium]|jgi:chemotaxis protein MotA|nr:flagellar motor protein [Gammaproteobacteria bacterium]MBU0772125.1 flagellar motor protein [Gammaproteobacteria bacterium]MBU1848738.1 flagellar motor protein [Gammaproteobacteria bacterium]